MFKKGKKDDDKKKDDKKGKKGSAQEEVAATPPQNPYLSLTHKDIFGLQASYKAVRRSMEETGVAMFLKLFETHEDLKAYFEKFKGKDNSQLANNQALHNHAVQVMELIDTVVTELEEAEKSHQLLLKIGRDHKNRNIKVDHIDFMKAPFLKAVEETLGDRYTDRMRNIYETFFDYVIKTIKQGYNS